jgi:hypothetical protein
MKTDYSAEIMGSHSGSAINKSTADPMKRNILHDDLRRYRKDPLSSEVLDLATVVIRDHYFSLKRRTKVEVYRLLLIECEKQGLTPPCYSWFAKEIKRELYETTRLREAPRSAYQTPPPEPHCH